MDIKRISDKVSVASQIGPEDLAAIKAAGFRAIINNRPDGEAPDQTPGDDIRRATAAQGLSYYAIPLGREGVNERMVAETRAILDEVDGPVLCYCRTGTRSTTLWALAEAGRLSEDEIIGAAREAGYDMSHLSGRLG